MRVPPGLAQPTDLLSEFSVVCWRRRMNYDLAGLVTTMRFQSGHRPGCEQRVAISARALRTENSHPQSCVYFECPKLPASGPRRSGLRMACQNQTDAHASVAPL